MQFMSIKYTHSELVCGPGSEVRLGVDEYAGTNTTWCPDMTRKNAV